MGRAWLEGCDAGEATRVCCHVAASTYTVLLNTPRTPTHTELYLLLCSHATFGIGSAGRVPELHTPWEPRWKSSRCLLATWESHHHTHTHTPHTPSVAPSLVHPLSHTLPLSIHPLSICAGRPRSAALSSHLSEPTISHTCCLI
jgi:hypothetical protein